MGRFLLVSHDAGGTVPPMLALAEALVAAGHRVTWLAQPSVALRAEAAGSEFVAFSALADYDPGRPIEEQPELAMPALTGRTLGDDVVSAVGKGGVEMVVVDANLTGALAAAETLECRSAVLLHSLYATFVETWFAHFWSFMGPAVNETRAGFGLEPVGSWAALFTGHDRIVSVVPAAFDAPAEELPGTMRHFGFLVPDGSYFPEATVDDRAPVVVASLSTTYMGHEDRAQAILDALAPLPVQTVLTLGGGLDPSRVRPPANARVFDRAHHPGLLAKAELVVTHAGLGTVAAALSHGLPLVCAPIARDQHLNAERVGALGAGVIVEDGADPDQLSDAVEAVLSKDSFREHARAVAELSRQGGGAPAVAEDLLAPAG